MITSFKDTCYIEILPHLQKSNRRKLLTTLYVFSLLTQNLYFEHTNRLLAFESVICLSFWAEVHYNSIYPEGGM